MRAREMSREELEVYKDIGESLLQEVCKQHGHPWYRNVRVGDNQVGTCVCGQGVHHKDGKDQ